jgi:hypothetical protein
LNTKDKENINIIIKTNTCNSILQLYKNLDTTREIKKSIEKASKDCETSVERTSW